MSRRREILLLVGLTMFALLLRVPAMGIGIWTDETLTASALASMDPATLIARVVAQENNPPGYYLLLWPWANLVGTGELALKLPSLVFGLLLVPATFVLGRLVAGREVGWLAAVMAAAAGTSIYQSQEARPYALVALLACLTVIFYVLTLEGRRPWLWAVLLALSGAALLYVQYPGGLVLGGLVLATLLNAWRGTGRVLPAIAAFVAIGIAFIPWVPTLLFHFRSAGGLAVAVPLADRPLLAIDNLGYGLPFPSSALRSWVARGLVVAAAVVLVALVVRPTGRTALRSWATSLRPGGLTLVVVVGVVAVTEALATYGERHMFLVSTLVWVLVSWAVVWLARTARRRWSNRGVVVDAAVAVGVGGLLLVGLGYAVALGAIPKSGIRTLIADEPALLASDPLVVLAPDYLESAYTYYLPDGPPPHGLAFWDFSRPIGGPEGWHDGWLDADARATLDLIAQEAGSESCLLFAYQPGPYDNVDLPYERSADLLAGLLARYQLVRDVEYPGRSEPVHMYLFALHPGGCET